MSTFPYFLIASLYLILFYGCYALLLRRNTFFGLNRAYLLLSLLASLILPLVELPSQATESLPLSSVTLPAFTVGADEAPVTNGLSVRQWLWLVYGTGVLVMVVRLAINVRAVFTLIRTGTAESWQGVRLIQLPNDSTPSFSFGHYLVLNHTDALTRPTMLIRHELAHSQQRHTADILFVELMRAVFWFNPALYLYKRSLQEIHEFLADQAAISLVNNTPDTSSDYARQLVAYAFQASPSTLITPFVSLSTLKQRIVMLHKPASNRSALLGYAFVLPVTALLTMCTQPEKELAQVEKESVVTTVPSQAKGVEGEIYTVVENQPTFPGGMEQMGKFLSENLKYPAAAQKANVGGRVFVSFIVTTTGEVKNVKILKGIGFGADEEAARVVAAMPHWKPGTQDGVPVNVQYNLPINFALEDDRPSSNRADVDFLKGIDHVLINGKEVTKEEFKKVDPNVIIRMDVNKEQGTIAITTK